MRHRLTSLRALVFPVACLTACAVDAGAGSVDGPGAGERQAPGPSVSELSIDVTRATTGAEIAVGNLDANIAAASEHYARTHNDQVRTRLVELLGLRAGMLGDYDAFDTVDSLTKNALDRPRVPPSVLVERAAFLNSVHRFEDARSMLLRAVDAGAAQGATRAVQSTLALALHEDLARRLLEAQQVAFEDDSHGSHTRVALLLAGLGRFEQADRSFVRALSRYRDTSPFVAAWNSFQRGVMWAEAAGRPDLARPLYEEAVRRLPQYVVANVHLAELEAEEDKHDGDDRAIARLQRMVESGVGDPEPAARLADLLLKRDGPGDRQAATTLTEVATVRYNSLLLRYPAAFADHAAEFFSGVGEDPSRALALALGNVDARGTPRAYLVAMRSAEAAFETTTYCRLAAAAVPLAVNHPVLHAATLDAQALCPTR